MIRAGFRPDDYAVTYRYGTLIREYSVHVAFMNLRRHIRTGADHSAPSMDRYHFAEAVLQHFYSQEEQYQAIWYDLPDHPYLQFLRNNDFNYQEYSLVQDSNHIEIMIRPLRLQQ